MSRVLVTGAAGFIGSHVVDRLLAAGREVIGVDSFTGYYSRDRKLRNLEPALGSDGFRLIERDLLDLDLRSLLAEVDAVVHLAAEPGVRRSWGGEFDVYLERNVRVTQRLLEAAGEDGDARFVYASSSSVYGPDGGRPVREEATLRPASPYGLTKLAAEELVALYGRERGVPATVLRYFTVYGPRQRPEMALSRFIRAAIGGREVRVFGDGEQVREMTFVADAVGATLAALDAPPGGTYNVGGGVRASVNQLLDCVRRTLGIPVEAVYTPAVEGDVRSTWADSGRAARDLGYRPSVTLEEGISAQAEWALRESLATSIA
ncbi:NAD-dependent epimerase/dehydratase family protein [soil metagenome]|nr:NAD-dependent epimerase/dehydratase family protein [Rubrobacter sp.]